MFIKLKEGVNNVRKYFILLVLSIFLVVSIFYGCAKPTPTPTPAPSPAPAPAPAPAKPIELHFGSWSSPKDPQAAAEQLAKELEEVTGGQVTMTMSYGGSLGRPPEYFDLAISGSVDIAFACPTYIPGRFPLLDIVNYPVYYPDNIIATKAFLEMWRKRPIN